MGSLKPFPMPPEQEPEEPSPTQSSQQPSQVVEQQPTEAAFASHAAAYQQPKAKSKRWLIVLALITLLLLAAGGAGGYYWWHKHQKPAPTKHQATTSPQPIPTSSGPATIKQYVSTGKDLNLSFNYPSSWTATPASGDNASDQTITLTSPLVSMPDADGTTGKVVVRLRPATAELDELSPGTATVAQDSIQFGYSKPTSSQHQYPYLTFIRLEAGSNASNTFDEVIITGITKFTKGQALTTDSLGQLDPIISATFYKCLSQACEGTNAKTLSITNDTWQNADVFKQVQALFESLRLK